MRLVLVVLLVALTGITLAPPAQADTRDAYGKQAATVARWGDCRNVRARSDGGAYALSGAVCDLRGERVNILTFSRESQEVTWYTIACAGLPRQWVTLGAGFVVTARNGNKAAAKVAQRVYGGDPYRCNQLV